MDIETQKAVDAIAADELAKGYRVKTVPESIQQSLKDEGLPLLTFVRFSRLNPARRRKIAEVVQGRYHRDLKNPDVLSTEQLLTLARERGEWSDALQAELDSLKTRVNDLQRELYLDGIKNATWIADYEQTCGRFRDLVFEGITKEADREEREAADTYYGIFARWSTWDREDQDLYTEKYAKEQGRAEYEPDVDFEFLMTRAPSPEMREVLESVDELRHKLQRYREFLIQRERRDELLGRYTRLMAESAESRREGCQAMANVYFCATQSDEQGVPGLPIAPTFDAFWDFPDDVVAWLVDEYYLFANNIPEAARDYLETFGFLQRPAGTETPGTPGEPPVSVASPAAPTDSSDTKQPEATPADSGDTPTTTNSTKSSSDS